MQITLTIEATPENLEKLKSFCSGVKAQGPDKKTKSKAEDIHKEEETAAAADTKETDAETAQFTKSDVRAVALKLSKAGKSNVLKEIFAKFGAEKLGDVPKDKYSELMRELVSANE